MYVRIVSVRKNLSKVEHHLDKRDKKTDHRGKVSCDARLTHSVQ